MRRLASVFAAALACATAVVSTQERPLTIVSASPRGDLSQLADAGEIRIVFSDPMVAIGDSHPDSKPAWLTISPSIPGSFYWSGTRTIVFGADPGIPLPYSTEFVIRVSTDAQARNGRRLEQPYEQRFRTPTVRLLSAGWYRKDGRFDSPIVVGLQFNQPVRAADVALLGRFRPTEHQWERPALSLLERERLARITPDGLARFDAKVDKASRVAAGAGDTFRGVAAVSWNEARFPRREDLVVLESPTRPEPESWLTFETDGGLEGVQGPLRGASQSTVIKLEPTFFAGLQCLASCGNGTGFLNLRVPTSPEAVAAAFSIHDLTRADHERVVLGNGALSLRRDEVANVFWLWNVGLPRQPFNSGWMYRLDESLTASDGQTLGYSWIKILDREHAPPLLNVDGHVWEAGGGRSIPITSRNVDTALVWTRQTTAGTTFDAIQRVLGLEVPQVAPRTIRLTTDPDVSQASRLDLDSALSPNGTGLVSTTLRMDQAVGESTAARALLDRHTLLQVTNLGITVKDSPTSTLVFVTSLDKARPVAGASVSALGPQGALLWRATTGEDGVALAPGIPRRLDDRSMPAFAVVAEKDGDAAFVAPRHFQDLTWEWRQEDEDNEPFVAAFTDRGAYRPGESVHLKVLLRSEVDGARAPTSEDKPYDVVIRDQRYEEVERHQLSVSSTGGAEVTWSIPDTATLGTYYVEVQSSAGDGAPRHEPATSFVVTTYRRPDFRVDIGLATDHPIVGSPLRATVSAAYLFGAPMAGRPVEWTLTRQPTTELPAAMLERFPENRFAFGYLASSMNESDRGAGVLDRGGRLAIERSDRHDADAAFRYTFEGDVEGHGGQHIANRASLVVHPAPFYVGLGRPSMLVERAGSPSIDVFASRLDGSFQPGVDVTLTLLRRDWRRVTTAPSEPKWEVTEIPTGQWRVRTSERAKALRIAVPTSGAYILRATATAASGLRTRTEVSFFAYGNDQTSWNLGEDELQLVSERQTFAPGEVARILVASPWPRATGLLTIERDGVRRYRRFDMRSTQTTLDIPITDADIPNVHVSVLLVKGRTSNSFDKDGTDRGHPGVRVGRLELGVNADSKRLTLSIRTDKRIYRPGESMNVDVSTIDRAGRPVPAEVTLWAVDHGLLSLTDYRTPDVINAIYAAGLSKVSTMDNRTGLIRRQRFHRPKHFTEAVPDEQVLETATVAAQASSSVRAAQLVGATPLGATRADFRPLVFWLGSAVADAAGHLRTTAVLPDSLTTYRVMAVASDASRFGWAEQEVTAARTTSLLPRFPRFVLAGDRARFTALATNSTGVAGDAVVTIQSLDPGILRFAEPRLQTLSVPSDSTLPIAFDAEAVSEGTARVRMTIRIGSDTDAFELSVPINSRSHVVTSAAYGEASGRAVERIVLPSFGSGPRATLRVDLATSALIGLRESLRYLVDYPYGCAEQKASRLLAMVLSSAIDGSQPTRAATDEITRAMKELRSFQCHDGGISLWPDACEGTNAYLTAYVLAALKVAGEASGIPADAVMVDDALDYLSAQMDREEETDSRWWPAWATSKAFAIRILAEHGRPLPKTTARLLAQADALPVVAVSHLADALSAVQDRGPIYQRLVERITNAIRVDADTAFVAEGDEDALLWLWSSNVHATAVVLGGLLRRQDETPFAAPLARWLTRAQVNGRWATTHENASALEALLAYAGSVESEAPDLMARVALGEELLGSATFQGRSNTTHTLERQLANATQAASTADLVIDRTGAGRLHYVARLQYSAPEIPSALSRGIRVERTYERLDPGGTSVPAGSLAINDLVRVTLTVSLSHEGRYLALTDRLPAGLETIDESLATAATNTVRAHSPDEPDDWFTRLRRGGFDHVEKRDDRVVAFATRLSPGMHRFTYLARATSAGTFTAPGAFVEAMYAPELSGKSAMVEVEVR